MGARDMKLTIYTPPRKGEEALFRNLIDGPRDTILTGIIWGPTTPCPSKITMKFFLELGRDWAYVLLGDGSRSEVIFQREGGIGEKTIIKDISGNFGLRPTDFKAFGAEIYEHFLDGVNMVIVQKKE